MEQKTRRRLRKTFGAVALVGLASFGLSVYSGLKAELKADNLATSSIAVSEFKRLSQDKAVLEHLLDEEARWTEYLNKSKGDLGEPRVYVQGSRENIQRQLENLSKESNKMRSDNREEIDEWETYQSRSDFYSTIMVCSFLPIGVGGFGYASMVGEEKIKSEEQNDRTK